MTFINFWLDSKSFFRKTIILYPTVGKMRLSEIILPQLWKLQKGVDILKCFSQYNLNKWVLRPKKWNNTWSKTIKLTKKIINIILV